jgi:hypothetical protein
MNMQGEKMKKERKERCAVDWSPEFVVHIREDLVHTDFYDDGERRVGSVFYLVAEDKKGHRWVSHANHKELASAKSERRHLARDFDPVKAKWNETDPCYGSEAWTPEVEGRIAYEERERDRRDNDWGTGR